MDAQLQYSDETLRVALFSGNYNYVMDGPVRALNMLVGVSRKNWSRGPSLSRQRPKKPAFQHSGTLISVPSLAIPRESAANIVLGLVYAARRGKRALTAFKPNLIHIAAPDYTGLSGACGMQKQTGIPALWRHFTPASTPIRAITICPLAGEIPDPIYAPFLRTMRPCLCPLSIDG